MSDHPPITPQSRNERWMEEVRRFARFAIVGVGNTIIDFGIFVLLTRIVGVYYLYANVASWAAAVCFSFFMNKYWTFRSRGTHQIRRQYLRFLAVNVIGLGISNGALFAFVQYAGLPDIIGKVLSIGVVTFWNFFMNKHWTFKDAS